MFLLRYLSKVFFQFPMSGVLIGRKFVPTLIPNIANKTIKGIAKILDVVMRGDI